MTEIRFRSLDAKQWVTVPFWRRIPAGYYDPHAGDRAAWAIDINWRVGMFFWHGRSGRPILAFRWKGAWLDGRRFDLSPLVGTGLLKKVYPMVDWLG